jgi:hypothetical protein
MIKLGSRGNHIQEIQSKLGLDDDGVFGKITQNAVINFQKTKKLSSDGIIGPITLKEIFVNDPSPKDFIKILLNSMILISNYQKRGVKYSQSKRQFGINANFSDCSATVSTILQMSDVSNKLKSTNTRSMRSEISSKGGLFRKNNPLVGDIMMWGSHVTIVVDMDLENVYFAHMGLSGARIAKVKMNNKSIESENTWGSGGFIGFWTIS